MAEKAAVTTIDFNVKCFPDVPGRRIDSAKYSRYPFADNRKLKVVASVPVPETDADAMAVFNMPLQELVALGVRQAIYGERFVTEFLVGKEDLTEPELETIRTEIESHLFKTEKAKTATSGEDKKVAKVAREAGLTSEQVAAAVALYLKQQAKAAK